ncbi:MAG: 2OG-Fe(II) oxygenase [Alphaproteobacteria bacterium]|nr:2OG-Fe(II) oxygenase [Alphaproteobacteria bacterium]
MDDILNLSDYPLNQLESEAGRALVARCQADLAETGMFNLTGLVRPAALAACVNEVVPELEANAYSHAQEHNIYFKKTVEGLASDHPALKTSRTSNRKICGDQMDGFVLTKIYEWPPLAAFLAAVMGKPRLHVMADPLARVNVMTYTHGETLNWHFDRSEFTTTLLLQAPDAGGEFQYRSGLRSDDDPNYDGVAKLLAGEDDELRTMPLSSGTLNVFRGKNTAHRVSTVEGSTERILAVFSYYERAGVNFSTEDRIKFYGRAA